MIYFILVFKWQNSWPFGLFCVFNVYLPFSNCGELLCSELQYFSYRTEDGLSLMDAHCSLLWFQENSLIVFCTYLLELLSKKGRRRRGNKKGKTMTAAKTSSLIVKYWVGFNGFYFALTCSLVWRAGHILPTQPARFLSLFLSCHGQL